MNRRFSGLLSFLLLAFAIWLSFQFDQPDNNPDEKVPLTQFSTKRAFEHVQAIGEKPHYLGSRAHSEVRNYIVNQLQEMGLEVQTQEGYVLNKHAILTKPTNILARLKGSGDGEALLLMTHYDSAPHSSFGASDAGSGVATILEGIRAFLARNSSFKNDIIILFTDAEELGLNGAELFVKDHPWAKDVALALNFEARGSGGNSFMLLETNDKNAKLIEAFKKANPRFPVTNSLAYSIYKMLPNDTDLTVLREQSNINGYNFAFIDDHYDYHTALDKPENLDKETLAQQGSYLMPLLDYFKDADLENLNSDRDLIYFNLPFGLLVTYSFDWITPMLVLAILTFLVLMVYGIKKERLDFVDFLKGFPPLLLSLLLSGFFGWIFWKLWLLIYPRYNEMEHGFTYNGYWYIAAVIFLAFGICFLIYNAFRKKQNTAGIFPAALLVWIVLCWVISVYLKGASYFIIPVYFGLVQFAIMIFFKKPNRIIMAVLCFPAIFILFPFICSLPVALGLKMLFVTAILISLLFLLFLPVFGYFKRLKMFGIHSLLTFAVLLIIAHFHANFNEKRPKPNSLVYMQDLDDHTAHWYSYDHKIDAWTSRIFGEHPKVKSNQEMNFQSKYGSNFTFEAEAPFVSIPQPDIILNKKEIDSGNVESYSMKIAPNREINRIDIYEINDVKFNDFKVDDLEAGNVDFKDHSFHMFKKRWQERILTYFASGNDTLKLEFSVPKGEKPKFIIYESAYDLLQNKKLKVEERTKNMIPRPFVLNDASILKKTVTIE
ncbi:peptidase M28 [Christiangramia fulva]|uniref:Vacuolar membrane protease n=1 Tax=Christiangramia fulva TaxID=2126553 RepID=A0A2R3Z460_9FLAO|nr:M28 family peptidase [Christiangramia fulva]AVR45002.1 peptidase M28 [Christiangramia fulva]